MIDAQHLLSKIGIISFRHLTPSTSDLMEVNFSTMSLTNIWELRNPGVSLGIGFVPHKRNFPKLSLNPHSIRVPSRCTNDL